MARRRKLIWRDDVKKQVVMNDYGEIRIHHGEMPDRQCVLAQEIARHLGIATAKWNGKYTPRGTQEWELMAPAEVAERACNIAQELWAEFHKRQWMTEIPLTDELLGINKPDGTASDE